MRRGRESLPGEQAGDEADLDGELYLRARVEYDGTEFFGFQRQATHRTVQGELERALEAVTRRPVRVIGAGRTDTGVHAMGQVVAFRVVWRHPIPDLERAWNALLPEDIAVWRLERAPKGFHPRFSARSRWYRYTIWNGGRRSPLWRRYAWVVPEPLNERAMQEAARCLVGEHDFAAFGQPPQGENTVRHIFRAEWVRDGDVLRFDIEGNAFLKHMVRNLVGAFLYVGRGQRPPEWLAQVLEGRDRARCAPPAPPCGLCLMEVAY